MLPLHPTLAKHLEERGIAVELADTVRTVVLAPVESTSDPPVRSVWYCAWPGAALAGVLDMGANLHFNCASCDFFSSCLCLCGWAKDNCYPDRRRTGFRRNGKRHHQCDRSCATSPVPLAEQRCIHIQYFESRRSKSHGCAAANRRRRMTLPEESSSGGTPRGTLASALAQIGKM